MTCDIFLELLAREASAVEFEAPLVEARAAGADPETLAELERTKLAALRVRSLLERRARREAELAALFETASDLAGLRDVDAVLEAIVRRARRLLNADISYMTLHDDELGDTYMRVTDGSVSAAFRALRLPPGAGLGGLVAETGTPYTSAAYISDGRFRHKGFIDSAVKEEGLVAILGVPMRLGTRVIGVLFAANRSARPFAPEEVALLGSLAAHAAIALDNARLLAETRAALEELGAANTLIRAHSEAVERAAQAHDRMTALVVRGGGVEDLAAVVTEILGGSLEVLDADGRELATVTPPGPPHSGDAAVMHGTGPDADGRAPAPGGSSYGGGLSTDGRTPAPGGPPQGAGLDADGRAPAPGGSAYGAGLSADGRRPAPGGPPHGTGVDVVPAHGRAAALGGPAHGGGLDAVASGGSAYGRGLGAVVARGRAVAPGREVAEAAASALALGRVVQKGDLWVAAIAAGNEALGTLVLRGAGDLDGADQRILERAALVTGLLLLFRRSVAEAEGRVRGELLEDLLGGRVADEEALRGRGRLVGIDLTAPHVVLVARHGGGDRRRVAFWAASYAAVEHGLVAARADQTVLLLPGTDPGAMARRVARELGAGSGEPATVGAAGPIGDPADVPAAYREAERCADALVSLGRAGDGAGAAELGFVGLLIGDGRDVGGFLDSAIGSVADYDRRRGTALIATLEAYFGSGGSLARTAERLHIHVNTVTQRLDRISRLLGPDWQTPERALEIQLALRLHRLGGR